MIFQTPRWKTEQKLKLKLKKKIGNANSKNSYCDSIKYSSEKLKSLTEIVKPTTKPNLESQRKQNKNVEKWQTDLGAKSEIWSEQARSPRNRVCEKIKEWARVFVLDKSTFYYVYNNILGTRHFEENTEKEREKEE